jgi:multidrug efflux pump subunit AcrB
VSEEKKIWRVQPMVRAVELEDELNSFAAEGYQIHSVQFNDAFFVVVAFDPTQIMKKQSEDMQAQMNALMANLPAAGVPPVR